MFSISNNITNEHIVCFLIWKCIFYAYPPKTRKIATIVIRLLTLSLNAAFVTITTPGVASWYHAFHILLFTRRRDRVVRNRLRCTAARRGKHNRSIDTHNTIHLSNVIRSTFGRHFIYPFYPLCPQHIYLRLYRVRPHPSSISITLRTYTASADPST